jgi:hypothetical protein
MTNDQNITKRVNGDNILPPYLNCCHHWLFVQRLTIRLIQNINSNIQDYKSFQLYLVINQIVIKYLVIFNKINGQTQLKNQQQ